MSLGRPERAPSEIEFIAMIGTLFATIAFSIDSMLPALPAIAQELSPDSPNLAQLIITSFVLGMGIGTFVVGPLSDAFGRRRVIFAGAILYGVGAIWSYSATSLEGVLGARVLAGIGVSAPRIVTMAIVRDLYSGRVMARIFSFAMTVFTVFPAIAPLIGAAIIAGFGWRAIFLSFVVFCSVSVGWLALRQPETLPPERRRLLTWPTIRDGVTEALSWRQMRLSILTQTLIFGMLFAGISSIQPIFDIRYGMQAEFPLLFFFMALLAMPAAFINGTLVVHLGMRPLVRISLSVVAVASAVYAVLALSGAVGQLEVWVFFAYCVILFANAAFTIGNLNALALEPLGHIAGLASSLMAGLSTVAGAVLGASIGQLFDGTAVPFSLAVIVLSSLGVLIMRVMPREGA